MKCERCGKELSDSDLYCSRCGKAVFPEYMDEEDIWAYYKSDEELEQILMSEGELEGNLQKEVSGEKSGKQEVSSSEISEAEEPAKENLQPEIVETETEEPEDIYEEVSRAALSEEENSEELKPENTDNQDLSEEISDKENFVTDGAGFTSVSDSVQEREEEPKEKEKFEDSESLPEDIRDQSEDFDEEEEDEEEEKEPLTPEKKRARRYTAFLAAVFLFLCLAAGIILGIRRMNQLDILETEYDQKIKESEKETSSADTGNIRLQSEKPDLSQNTKLQPISVQSDSQKQSEEEDYSGSSLIDGDQTTSWQEGEEGTGEGKGVTIILDSSHQIRYLVLYLGNWKSNELWNYNARPKSLAIQIGEEEEILEFPNEKIPFYLVVQEPIEASEIKIRIQSSYDGERWEDNCISEIEIYE